MASEPFRILIAPSCLKGSVSALEMTRYIADFLRKRGGEQIELDLCPVADGGDDTLDILQYADSGFLAQGVEVMGPLPEMLVQAKYLVHPHKRIAILEAAQAHGYKLLIERGLAPMEATSYGVGQLLRFVLDHEPDLETVVLTLGGSASTDGGFGALQALGVQFLDVQGAIIQSPIDGGLLPKIHQIQWNPAWNYSGMLMIATDTLNPLLGSAGTAFVFAPQKGASPEQCQLLEHALRQMSRQMASVHHQDHTNLSGAGAAGGLAYGLSYLPRTRILSGSQWIADYLQLKARLQNADAIITSEGRLDATSLTGKAIGNILATAPNKPIFIICGQQQEGLALPEHVTVLPLLPKNAPETSIQSAIRKPLPLIEAQFEQLWPKLQALCGQRVQ